jgi:hypothetical protein
MTRSPDSLVSFAVGQPAVEKRDDKAFICWQEGEANLRAAIQMNAVSASSNPPAITPIQLDLFPGRACVPTAKPATTRHIARMEPSRRDGVSGGGTQRQTIELTGETLFGPAEATSSGREAYKGETRKRGNEAGQGVGGGRSTEEPRDNRGEGRAATSIMRSKLGKAAGMPPRGKAQPPAQSSQAPSARETRQCPRTSEDATPRSQAIRRTLPEEDGRRAGCDMWPPEICGGQRVTGIRIN